MTTRRVLAMIVSALGVVGLIALVFGNQWLSQSLYEHDVFTDRSALGRLFGWLQIPQWRVTPVRLDYLVPADLSLIVLLAALGLLVLAAARSLDPRQGAFGALMVGWWATTAAAGVAGLVRALLQLAFADFPSFETGDLTLGYISSGASFGLVFGWLPGLGTMIAFLVTRPRGSASETQGASGAPAQGTAGIGPIPQPAAPGRYPLPNSGWAPVPPPPTPGPTGPQPVPGVPPGPTWAPPPPPGGYPPPPAGFQPPPPAGYPVPPPPPPGYPPAPPPQGPPAPPPQGPLAAVPPGSGTESDGPVESAEPAAQAETGDHPPSEVLPESQDLSQSEDHSEPEDRSGSQDGSESEDHPGREDPPVQKERPDPEGPERAEQVSGRREPEKDDPPRG